MSAPAAVVEWQRAAARVEVTARGGLRVQVNGRWVALLLWNGRVHAIDDRCPHRGSSLADGVVEDGYVSCLEHGWEYDLATGNGRRPWEGCVEVFECEERGAEVWVRVPPRALPTWAMDDEP